MYHVPVLFFIQTPLDLMMRPALWTPPGESGSVGAPSEHHRSTLGAPSEHPRSWVDVFGGTKKPSKKNIDFWTQFCSTLAPTWHHFWLILHIFFDIFFDEKMILIFPCLAPPVDAQTLEFAGRANTSMGSEHHAQASIHPQN